MAAKSLVKKVISRSFELHRDYSNSLTLSNVQEFVWFWIAKNPFAAGCVVHKHTGEPRAVTVKKYT